MTDPFPELTAIVRERHQTGAYGNCHLQVAPDLIEQFRKLSEPPKPAWRRDSLAGLLAIPIVPIAVLAEGGWRLVAVDYDVDNDREPPYVRRETVVKEGTVTP